MERILLSGCEAADFINACYAGAHDLIPLDPEPESDNGKKLAQYIAVITEYEKYMGYGTKREIKGEE